MNNSQVDDEFAALVGTFDDIEPAEDGMFAFQDGEWVNSFGEGWRNLFSQFCDLVAGAVNAGHGVRFGLVADPTKLVDDLAGAAALDGQIQSDERIQLCRDAKVAIQNDMFTADEFRTLIAASRVIRRFVYELLERRAEQIACGEMVAVADGEMDPFVMHCEMATLAGACIISVGSQVPDLY